MRDLSFYLRALPDLLSAWVLEPTVERARVKEGPVPLIEALRRQGRTRPGRDEAGRARLREAIALAERLRGRIPNCYRRVLLEIALDAGAARERVFLALDSGGGPGSGHAYLQSHPDAGGTSYDAVFDV